MEEPTFEDLFKFPNFFLTFCSYDWNIFQNCLQLSKLIRQQLMQYEWSFQREFPDWNLRWPIPNLIMLAMSRRKDVWFLLNKHFLPKIPIYPPFELISDVNDVNWDVLEFPDSMEVCFAPWIYGKKICTITLTRDTKCFFYYDKSNEILIQAAVYSDANKPTFCNVSRNFPEFLSYLRLFNILAQPYEIPDGEVFQDDDYVFNFRDVLVSMMPRDPLFQYDFCCKCQGSRFTGQKAECYACLQCANYTVCDKCLIRTERNLNDQHEHVPRDVMDIYDEEEDADKLENLGQFFCFFCKNYLWEYEPGFAFTCQHQSPTQEIPSRTYCYKCIENCKTESVHENCSYTLDRWTSGFDCDRCKRNLYCGEEHYTCSFCYDNGEDSYDLCLDCFGTDSAEHIKTHESASWQNTFASPSVFCDECKYETSKYDVSYYCRHCFKHFCDRCGETHDFVDPINRFKWRFGKKI